MTMPHFDDIPQAARDLPLSSLGEEQPSWLRRTRLLRRIVGLALLALAAGGLVAWYQTNGFSAVEFAQPFETMINRSAADSAGGRGGAGATAADSAQENRDVAAQLAPSSRTLLNHRAYDEAPAEDLVTLSANASIRCAPLPPPSTRHVPGRRPRRGKAGAAVGLSLPGGTGDHFL
jgi:D-alanyl-D-alanine carboxypeptidase